MTRRTQFLVYVTVSLMMAAFMTACGSKTTTVAVSSTAPGVVYSHSAGIKADGNVYTWGYNGFGQLGNNTITNSPVPVVVQGLPANMSGVSAGGSHTLAFKNMSGVFAWGNNGNGQLGNGNFDAKMLPVPVLKQVTPSTTAPLTNVLAVSAGGFHSLAIDNNDHTVWAWGDDLNGQLGDGTIVNKTAAVKVVPAVDGTTLNAVVMVAAGGLHSLALQGGKVWAWGDNTYGQLGNNATSTTPTSIPVQVVKENGSALDNIIAIAAGGSHSLALDGSGNVWAWGLNQFGQLGNEEAGDTTTDPLHSKNKSFAVPVHLGTVLGPTTVASGAQPLAAGLDHSLLIDANGNVWAWGLNFNGQLGNGALEPVNNVAPPRPISGVSKPVKVTPNGSFPFNVTQVVAVGNHSLAFTGDGGTAWSWGDNTFGQLGINTTDKTPNGPTKDSSLAVPVTGFP